MLQGIVYLVSFALGTNFMPAQSPKIPIQEPIVVENIQELPQEQSTDLDQYHGEAQQLSFVLGEQTAQEPTTPKPGPIVQWLRQDKAELSSQQVKRLPGTSITSTDGAGTQFVVYKQPQSTSEKVLSYQVNNTEKYALSVGSAISLTKGNEQKMWTQSSDQNFQPETTHVATIRTENVFGLTDIFLDGKALSTEHSSFKQVDIEPGGEISIGSFSTDVLEFILYDRQLSEEERRNVEMYLRLKYNLPIVDSTDVKIWDTVENKEYSNNGFSLVRQDSWDFQRTSAETIYEDGTALRLSTLSQLPDNTFLIIGDNAKPTSTSDSSYPPFQRMMGRVWKVENESALKNFSLHFKPSITNASYVNDMALVVAKDAIFTDAKIYLPQAIENNEAVFTDVTISDELYFTFAFQKRVDDLTPFLFSAGTTGLDLSQSVGPGGVNNQLMLWLRADAGVQNDGEHVQKWSDMSGHQNDLTADLPFANGTAPVFIADELNFHPVVQFNKDRLTDYLGREEFDLAGENQKWTQFVVYQHQPGVVF